MYLGGVARPQFLYVTTMEPLLGLIDFGTSREFNYGLISESGWSIMKFCHGQFLGSYHATGLG